MILKRKNKLIIKEKSREKKHADFFFVLEEQPVQLSSYPLHKMRKIWTKTEGEAKKERKQKHAKYNFC